MQCIVEKNQASKVLCSWHLPTLLYLIWFFTVLQSFLYANISAAPNFDSVLKSNFIRKITALMDGTLSNHFKMLTVQ